MNGPIRFAHSCEDYSWIRFPRPAGDHEKVVAQATERAATDHGWSAQELPLSNEVDPTADDVSAIVFRSREATRSVIKVTVISTRVDDRYETGYGVTVCSRKFDAYQGPLPDEATALAQVSSVCGQGSQRLAGL